MTEIKNDEAATPSDLLHAELLEFFHELGERVPELPTVRRCHITDLADLSEEA